MARLGVSSVPSSTSSVQRGIRTIDTSPHISRVSHPGLLRYSQEFFQASSRPAVVRANSIEIYKFEKIKLPVSLVTLGNEHQEARNTNRRLQHGGAVHARGDRSTSARCACAGARARAFERFSGSKGGREPITRRYWALIGAQFAESAVRRADTSAMNCIC